MPAVISHYVLADRVYNTIKREYPTVSVDRNIMLWGAAGPDLFFAHRIMPWQKQQSLSRISHIMHDGHAERLLNFLADYSRANESDAAFSYAFGFVTHYAFDSIAHPFIVGYAEMMAEGRVFSPFLLDRAHEQLAAGIRLSSVYHNQIEGFLDTLLLMKDKHIPIGNFHMQDSCPDDIHAYKVVSEMLATYLDYSYIYPEIDPAEVERAMKDWRRCLVLLNDRFALKRSFLRGAERLLHMPPFVSVFMRNIDIDTSDDPANLAHRKWVSQADGSIHTESFFELTDMAEEKSLQLISRLADGQRLTKDDCSASFSGRPLKG